MRKKKNLVKVLFLIAAICLTYNAPSGIAEEITLKTIIPNGGGSLGDTVLIGSIENNTDIGTNLSFTTNTDGFIIIAGRVSGGGDAWAELKIDGVLWGPGGILTDDNDDDNRNFNANPYVYATIPVKKGKTCTITKRYRRELEIDVYWVPLNS